VKGRNEPSVDLVRSRLNEWGGPRIERPEPALVERARQIGPAFAGPSGAALLELMLDLTLRRPVLPGTPEQIAERQGQNAIVLTLLAYLNIAEQDGHHDRHNSSQSDPDSDDTGGSSPYYAIS
jgi:hypothetical protein